MLLSIIIPIYNVEKYLKACVESILIQDIDFSLIEIILVNDGSIDNSGQTADTYAERYPYISVIHQSNQGVSVARNAGLSQAKGDYIWFIDSDDILLKNFTSLIGYLDGKIDILEFTGTYIDKQGARLHTNNNIFPSQWHNNVGTAIDNTERLKNDLSYYGLYFICFRIIRRSLLKTFRFPEGIGLCEDALFLTECYYNAQSIQRVDDVIYGYRQHDTNVTKVKSEKNLIQLAELCNIIYLKITAEINHNNLKKAKFYSYLLINMIHLRKRMQVDFDTTIQPDKFTRNFSRFIIDLDKNYKINHSHRIKAYKWLGIHYPTLLNCLFLMRNIKVSMRNKLIRH